MKLSNVVAVFIGLGLAFCAQAAEPKKTAAQPGHGAASPKSQRVCTNEAVTGSHLKRRVCATEEQREEQRQASQNSATRLNRSQSGLSDRKGSEGR